MSDPNITDELRQYFIKARAEWKAQLIITGKSLVTYVREHRDAIDAAILEAVGPQGIRLNPDAGDHFDATDDNHDDGLGGE